MKAYLKSKSCGIKKSFTAILSIITFLPVIYPHMASAQNTTDKMENEALIFEVQNLNSNTNNNLAKVDDIAEADPLVQKLKEYLEKHKSPLAAYSSDIVTHNQWKRALAISWVESNFGRFCHSNNCSGIGVAPGHPLWRKYETKLDWFTDMNELLNKPIYREKYTTFRKMKGIYVYPGSENWVNGAEKKFAELTEIEKQAEEEKLKKMAEEEKKYSLLTFKE